MAHDKPKVTIDLAEYQELQEKATDVSSDEFVQDAKLVIATFINCRLSPSQATEALRMHNIAFTITETMGRDVEPSNIIIKRINQ